MADGIITRKQALAQGLKTYYTGKPCVRSHIDTRLTASGECRSCNLDRQRLRYHADPEAACERVKRYAAENPEKRKEWVRNNRDKRREVERRWKARNPDKVRAYSKPASKRWRLANPEKRREVVKRWQDANPEIVRVNSHKRRARKAKAEGSHTPDDLRALLTAQSHQCAYCRTDLRKVKKHLDHIQPLARGGSNDKTNLQWLCVPCNRSKGAKDPLQFAQERGLLL
jgi:5-methylcytosine-specific restriction endonuclease McrA